jgi:predicted amidohydrolase
MQGAHLIAYVNNAIGSSNGHDLWRAHLINRAAETQRFVAGANNAAPDQTCSTLIVTPAGRVIEEAPIGQTAAITSRIELSEVSDWVIGQSRSDVVAVTPELSAEARETLSASPPVSGASERIRRKS